MQDPHLFKGDRFYGAFLVPIKISPPLTKTGVAVEKGTTTVISPSFVRFVACRINNLQSTLFLKWS